MEGAPHHHQHAFLHKLCGRLPRWVVPKVLKTKQFEGFVTLSVTCTLPFF